MLYFLGWILWGLSANDNLQGTDGVIAWIDDGGVGNIYDINYSSSSQPSIDQQQNYQLLNASETADTMSFTFKRKLHSSDESDIPITTSTARIQWGWGDQLNPMSISI